VLAVHFQSLDTYLQQLSNTMAALYDNLMWREAAPGVWQRDADEPEQFYATLIKLYEGSGRMQFAITGHVSLTIAVPDTESVEATSRRFDASLRIAWLRLRHDIPTIASCVNYDAAAGKWKKTYNAVPDRNSQNVWLKRTFQSISVGKTGTEWANSDPPAPREATLFVIVPPVTSPRIIGRDLVLRSPHDIIDGIGTLQLFGNYIAHVAKAFAGDSAHQSSILDGSETARLSPSYRIAAAVPAEPTAAQAQKLVAAKEDKSNATERRSDEEFEDIGIPYRSGPALPGKHQRVAHTISADRASQLLAAVKRINATVTHAFHTAIAMGIRDVHAEQLGIATRPPGPCETRRVRYNSYILRNERSKCDHPFNTPAHCAAVYHSVSRGRLMVDMPLFPSDDEANAEFERILVRMRDYYHRVRDDTDHYALAPYIWAAATPEIALSASTVSVPPPNPRPSVSISSMGLIDHIIGLERGPIHVYNPWVTGEELGNGLGLFLGTFRGELCLSAAFNDAWHDKDEVEGFLSRCEEIVFAWVQKAGGE
jgi:hypothetical protein